MNPTAFTSARSLRWVDRLVIVIALAVVFGQSLRFDFVTYDDQELIVQNAAFLARASNIPQAFAAHAFASSRAAGAYYRPLLVSSYILDYHVWALRPLGYHLSNCVLHALAALLVLQLIRSLTRERLAAVFGGLLFAVHPVQTESVAWVAGRNDVLLGLFVVLMMVLYASAGADRAGNRWRFPLACVCFAAALFTKESAAFYIVLLPLYDLSTGRRPGLRLLVPVAILMVYLAVRFAVLGAFIGAERLYGAVPFVERLTELPAMVVEQCRFVLLPLSLSVVHIVRESVWTRFPWNILAGLIVLALGAGLFFAWKKDRTMFFGLAWFAAGLLPALNIIPLAVPLLEHRMYVPLAGAAIAAARFAQLLAASPARARLIRWASLCVIAGAGSVSFMRLPVWTNSETLWTDAIAKAPTAGRSYLNLAGYYFEREEYDKTAGLMRRYLALEPDDLLAYARLRQTYVLNRQYGEASAVCRAMIARNPGNPHRYIELAKFFEQLNQPDSARSVYREAIAADPTSDEAAVDLGILSERLGDRCTAAESYSLATRIAPRHAYPYFALGRLLALDARDEDALRTIEAGAALGEPPKDIVKLAVGLYEKHGRRSDAERLKQRYGTTE